MNIYRMKRILFLLLLTPSLFFTACKDEPKPEPHKKLNAGQPQFKKEGELTFKKPDGAEILKINIEIADNDGERQQGLMNRSVMSNTQGMLFIFDVEEPQAFWMKNTILPLDIIYVNAKMEIVSIAENTTPFSEQSIPSHFPAQYVVEVNAGFCAQYGIVAGSVIKFERI